jgi:tetraacyldisaccharide 4'-kinase
MNALRELASGLYGAAWETRRRAYAAGIFKPRHVPARVVSVGNLTVGGTGKTTLTLHLARRALARGIAVAVACRRYRPGPGGEGDEERLYRDALGPAHVFAGRSKADRAAAAAAAGHALVLVDDAFSHWALARDVDVVVMDADDPWGGGRLLPAGRLREPRRALQRARAIVVSRLAPEHDVERILEDIAQAAPAALRATARHRARGARGLDGAGRPAGGRAWIVTGTGNPAAFERTAREAGYEVAGATRFRDHHWFSAGEALAALANAARAGAAVLLTAKDAVRWPVPDPSVRVLEVEWEWCRGGDAVEALVFDTDRDAMNGATERA